jgi:flagellar biosynthesis/type III secretory pathway M-ring protein FliF/YscJ
MTGYVVLIVFIVFVLSCFGCFLVGYTRGKKTAQAEYAEDHRRKEQDAKDFKKVSEEIKQEVFKDAEQKKAEMAGYTNPDDRFNDINSKLRNNPQG